MPPLFIRLASCCKSVKFPLNLRSKSVRRLAYSTCSNVPSDSSSDTIVLSDSFEEDGMFKVTETLDQWKRERSSALLIARRVKESAGFRHDVEHYMAIIRLLCDSDMDVGLNHLFTYVTDNINKDKFCFEISDLLEALIEEKLIKAVDALVMVYASFGKFEWAMHTLSEMKSRSGLMVSTRTCNFFLNELIEWNKTVDPFYGQLKTKGLIPDVDTYEILIKGHCRFYSFERIWEIYAEMREAGVEPNAYIYGSHIYGLCSVGQTDRAFDLLRTLTDANKPVDVFAYTSVIRGFVQQKKLQWAEKVLHHEMKIRKVVPDSDCYSALFLKYKMKGETAKASDLCKEMESRGINSNYVYIKHIMLKFCHKRKFDKGLEFIKKVMQLSPDLFIDGLTFDLAIDAACQLGRMEDAMELVEGLKGRKGKLWRMHYRTLIDGYCLRGEPWKALHMFHEMIRDGLKPDIPTYHVLARGFQGCGVSLPLHLLFKSVK